MQVTVCTHIAIAYNRMYTDNSKYYFATLQAKYSGTCLEATYIEKPLVKPLFQLCAGPHTKAKKFGLKVTAWTGN